MKESRRKVVLPVFQLSELTDADDPRALKRVIPKSKARPRSTYFYRIASDESRQQGQHYNLLPIVLERTGAPWQLATVYILDLLSADAEPVMPTYLSKADDLGAFREWLDSQDEGDGLMLSFPRNKLRRPTYRYRGHLRQLIEAGELSPTTAKRRMTSVVAFYRWLLKRNYFEAEHQPWEEKRYQLSVTTTEGRRIWKSIATTDVGIKAPRSEDPLRLTISDGGRLRPLSAQEQAWVIDTTRNKGNTECFLIQLFMLGTGARIQTVGTLRLRHFAQQQPNYSNLSPFGKHQFHRLKAGPGTGIDTKNDKNGILHVPRPLYELLHAYANSRRATIRRERFVNAGGSPEEPYLFITQQGHPYYISEADAQRFDPHLNRRHQKTGQPVRQFIKDYVIPTIRTQHDLHFYYRIHDLRASFGMNITEALLKLVQEGKLSLGRARLFVRDLMWHEDLGTTDLYLNYRSQLDAFQAAVDEYGEQLQIWAKQAMSSVIATSDE